MAQLADFGRQVGPRVAEFGQKLGPQATDLGRKLGHRIGPLTQRGVAATRKGLVRSVRSLANVRVLVRLLARFFAGIGTVTLVVLRGLARGTTVVGDRVATALENHRAVLFSLLTRALWWAALALLVIGGQKLVRIDNPGPFVDQALPVFLTGLGFCAFLLVFAAQTHLRWGAFVLAMGHGGLLSLVWLVAAIG